MIRLMDRSAVMLSAICVLHCLAGGIAVALLLPITPLLGHGVHSWGLALAAVLAVFALGSGWLRHGRAEPMAIGLAGLLLMAAGLMMAHGGIGEFVLTATGALLVAGAHFANRRAFAAAG